MQADRIRRGREDVAMNDEDDVLLLEDLARTGGALVRVLAAAERGWGDPWRRETSRADRGRCRGHR